MAYYLNLETGGQSFSRPNDGAPTIQLPVDTAAHMA